MMNMARANDRPSGDELRAQVEALLKPGRVEAMGVAWIIGISPEALIEWLAHHPIKTSLARFEREIADYLESRAAWLASVRNADAIGRQTLRLQKADEIREMVAKMTEPPALPSLLATLQAAIAFLLDDLLLLEDEINENTADMPCWKCRAPRNPPPATVENQIEIWLQRSAWAGWPPERFREALRSAMADGDRILAVNPGRVWVRRPNGSVYRVLIGWPINGGGVEEAE